MKINRSIDIEDEVRKALSPYMAAYCQPLPAEYDLPNIIVHKNGGTDSDTIDTFTVSIDSRAKSYAEADETLRNAIGVLKKTAELQTTQIRHVEVNTFGSWGSDPVRPDLSMCSATLLITAHQEVIDLQEG